MRNINNNLKEYKIYKFYCKKSRGRSLYTTLPYAIIRLNVLYQMLLSRDSYLFLKGSLICLGYKISDRLFAHLCH